MRKLDYLRKALKKCHNYSDVKAIELPREFKWWFDLYQQPFIESVTKLSDGSLQLAVRHDFDDVNEDGYPFGSAGYETYVLHPRKGFIYGWNS